MKSNGSDHTSEGNAWYCIRSQPKHEHIAAAHLGREEGVEIFLPRVRFRRATRQGKAWVTEALFPGYLFARFSIRNQLRLVQYTSGVSTVVHFGDRWPTIPAEVIEALRKSVGDSEPRVIPDEFEENEAVRIVAGPLRGLEAVVTRVMPGSERVAVLLEFLGQQIVAETTTDSLVREGDQRPRMV